MLAVGDSAPDFTLRDQNNELFSLASFRGQQAVLLVFYPFAFTGICTGELDEIRDDPDSFATDTLRTAALSCDTVYSHKIFAERGRFDFALLSDFWPHGAVARSYGVFSEEVGVALRGTFLVDVDGIVRFAECNAIGQGRDPAAWRAAIAAL